MKRFVVLFFMVLIWSCSDSEVTDPCPPNCPEEIEPYDLEQVWESQFTKFNDRFTVTSDVIESEDYIIIGVDYIEHNESNVMVFQKEDGELFKNFRIDHSASQLNILDDKLIIVTISEIKVYSLDDFSLLYSKDGDYNDEYDVYDNSIYVVQNFGSFNYRTSFSVLRIDVSDFSDEVILTINRETEYPYYEMKPINIDQVDGSVIMYGVISDEKRTLYAYNMNTNEYLWRKEIDRNTIISHNQLTDEKNIYLVADETALAIDKRTGDDIWSKKLEGQYSAKKGYMLGRYIYYDSSADDFYCIDKSDGGEVFHRKTYGVYSTNDLVDDGKNLYSCGNTFKRIDAMNGKFLNDIKGPYEKIDLDSLEKSEILYAKFAIHKPLISKTSRLIYIADHKRMFCFRMPEDW